MRQGRTDSVPESYGLRYGQTQPLLHGDALSAASPVGVADSQSFSHARGRIDPHGIVVHVDTELASLDHVLQALGDVGDAVSVAITRVQNAEITTILGYTLRCSG